MFPQQCLKAIFMLICLVLAGSARAEDRLANGASPSERPGKGFRIENIDRDANASVAWIKIRVVSDAPVQETWEVVDDIDHWGQAMDLVSNTEILEKKGDVSRYKLFISPPWPMSDFYSIIQVRRTSKPHLFLYWVNEGFMQGSFGKISAGGVPGGSWIFFESFGSPKNRFPDWMVKIGVHLVLPSVLKDLYNRILEKIRDQESTGGTEKPPSSGINMPSPTPGISAAPTE